MKYVFWLTGLSGSGKSTIAETVKRKLKDIIVLDGDIIRTGINKDLGFSIEDRIENIRRIAEIAKLFVLNNKDVIVSFISPTIEIRQIAKDIIGEGFVEVYINTSLKECEKRDVKGLYKKVRDGKITDFTGISSPYQAPTNPDIEIETEILNIEDGAEKVLNYLKNKKINFRCKIIKKHEK